jgi:hypothetical protein
MTATITFDLPLLYFVAVNVIGILIYVLIIKTRLRRQKISLAILTKEITVYFYSMGCEIGLKCFSLNNDDHFIAIIESAPDKRFRVSHKLEENLMQHISNHCKQKLDSVYWRFIVKEGEQEDAYLRDGLAVYETEESTLEEFHQIAASQRNNHFFSAPSAAS